MKRISSKKLSIVRESLRQLSNEELDSAAGGSVIKRSMACASNGCGPIVITPSIVGLPCPGLPSIGTSIIINPNG